MKTTTMRRTFSPLLAITTLTGIAFGAAHYPAAYAAPFQARQQAASEGQAPLPPGVTRTPVVFSGGYETDPRDRGRPVVLIAAALGVAPEVFREAFSHVNPARGGNAPQPDQVHANKNALLSALGKYGITNERLDIVSDYYRYPPGRGNRWRTTPAVANALVKDGVVIGYEIISGGSGYTTPPMISVPGIAGAKGSAKLAFGKRMESNGSISSIAL
jgi:hypothetical protein